MPFGMQPSIACKFLWLNESFGTNWRMTEMQAIIGRIQLKRMSNWHTKRINNANEIWNRNLFNYK